MYIIALMRFCFQFGTNYKNAMIKDTKYEQKGE